MLFGAILLEPALAELSWQLVAYAVLTVGLSVPAHGLTAAPLARRYEEHPRENPRRWKAPRLS